MCNIQIIRALALVLFLFTFQGLVAQSAPHSKLQVNVEQNSLVYFTLEINKGQTLYSICKKYRVEIGDALVLNDLTDPSQISVGQKIRLPLNKQHFFLNNQSANLTPVYYSVQPKETLFRVSKVYFSQDVKDMIERNQLTGFSLAIGQELVVGYFELGTSPSKPVSSNSLIVPEGKIPVQKVITEKVIKEKTETEITEETSPALNNNEIKKETQVTQKQIEITTDKEVELVQTNKAKNLVTKPDQIKKRSRLVKILSKSRKEKDLVLKTEEPQRASNPISTSELEEQKEVNIEEPVVEDSEAKLEAVVKETIVTDIVEEMDELPVEPTMVHVSKKGTAYWDKNGTDYENLMVLHKTAAVNTLIKLTNPINKLSTFARVVGQIPPNAFKKNIEVVMSPAVAKKIGIRDSKFQVEMVYQIVK